MKTSIFKPNKIRNGFTLVEVMMALGLFLLIVAGTISVYLMCHEVWRSTSLKMDTTQYASIALARMVYGLGTNNGLRTAASIDVNTNVLGCWVTGSSYPQPANASTHFLYTNFGTPNKSWRITSSNEFDGVKWIDYNRLASNIVFWPNIADSSSRELICNYVESATASNTGDGIFFSITITLHDGRFHATNTVSTFVKMRNK